MHERPDEWQAWTDQNDLKAARLASIEARHGPSMGIKFQLEHLWAGTLDLPFL